MFSVGSDKCSAFSINVCRAVYSVQCLVKCTGADAGAFAGAGAVGSVHCVVCSVLPAKYEDLAVETE